LLGIMNLMPALLVTFTQRQATRQGKATLKVGADSAA
jgi:hypothetical protein